MISASPGRSPVRVLVVDDHDLFRAGMAALLSDQPGIEVIAQASGGRMGVRLAAELRPDVVLMDLRMPDLEGPEATKEILADRPATRVVAMTVSAEDSDVGAALAAGACGFLAKDTPMEGVVTAILAAAQGAAWLSPRAARVMLETMRQGASEAEAEHPDLELLSARELDVLRLLSRGLENNQIADELGISPRTAKNHVSSVLAKLGVPSRVQAAIFAVRQGLS
jgi:DNA-binding NarL/FixJ family response regulator